MRCRTLGSAILFVLGAALVFSGSAWADVCDNPVNSTLLATADSPLGVPPQVLLASTPVELRQIVESLGIPAPHPLDGIAFTRIKVLVIVGESRTNGCRSTELRCVAAGSDASSAQAVIRENYPGCGCTCTMIFRGNAVFFVAVPDTIQTTSLLSEQNRFNCSSCLPCPIGNPTPTGGGSEVVVGQICR